MSKHQIIEFISITGQTLFIDATRIEAMIENDNDSLQTQIITSSEVYNVQCEIQVAVTWWKDAL